MVTVTNNVITVTVTEKRKGMTMNTQARIIIQAGHYVVIFLVDGEPVESHRCDDFGQAQALKAAWGE